MDLIKRARACAERKEGPQALLHAQSAVEALREGGQEESNALPQARIIGCLASGEPPKSEEAIPYYAKASNLFPSSPTPWQGLAKLHRSLKQWPELVADYGQLISIAK